MLLAIKNRVVCLCIIQVHGIVHLYVYIHNMVKTIANMANITLLWFIFGQKCAIISKINFLNKTFMLLVLFYIMPNIFREIFFPIFFCEIDFTKFFNVEKYHFCFQVCILVFLSVVFTVINVCGFAHYMGLTIEIVTSIILILTVGLGKHHAFEKQDL